MSNVKKIINYLKENKDVAEILNKQFDFDLIEVTNEEYSEIPSNKKRELLNKFVELGLIEKEVAERERRSNNRVDDVKHYYYNYDFKMDYLENYSGYKDETKRVLRVFFRKFADIEKELDKDIYDFNSIELSRAFKSIKSTTVRSLQNIVSMVGKYIDHAITFKKSVMKENLAYNFSSEDIAKKLVDTESNEKLYLTRDEVMYMAMNSINAQDGVIMALLHDGFSHKDNFRELINLKVSDIDWDLEVATIESREAFNNTIKLSKETLFLLKEAINNDIYLSTTSESDVVRQYNIKKTKYVLRGLRSKDENTKISWRNINQRILRQAEYFENEFLTATNIVVSSQIDCAYENYVEDKSIGDKAIRMALEKFNYPYNKSSLFNLKKKVNVYKGVHIV